MKTVNKRRIELTGRGCCVGCAKDSQNQNGKDQRNSEGGGDIKQDRGGKTYMARALLN